MHLGSYFVGCAKLGSHQKSTGYCLMVCTFFESQHISQWILRMCCAYVNSECSYSRCLLEEEWVRGNTMHFRSLVVWVVWNNFSSTQKTKLIYLHVHYKSKVWTHLVGKCVQTFDWWFTHLLSYFVSLMFSTGELILPIYVIAFKNIWL